MEITREILALSLLTFNTWNDLRKREILLIPTMLIGLAGFLLAFAQGQIHLSYFAGFFAGGMLFAGSLLSKGAVGGGDALVLLSLAALLSWDRILACLTAALLGSAFASLYLIVIKRKGRRASIPFLPFLLGGYLLCLIWERHW